MSHVAENPPLELKPDYYEANERWLAFWEQELIDRPCCVIRAPKDGVEPVPRPAYMSEAHEDFEQVIDELLASAATIWWGGEAIPHHSPSFGPDMMAGWAGAELHFSHEVGTSWAVPCIEDWDAALPITIDPDNYWWQRMLDFYRAMSAAFAGKMFAAHLDLHSNMDLLLAMRGGSQLCVDLVDIPEVIDRAMADVRALYGPVYDALYEAGDMAKTGTCSWIPAYHPVKTSTTQCDFAALVGPEHFRRWILPALEEEAAHVGHCVYHMDGPDQIVHLKDLCSIEGVDCIQWVQGAGQKPFIEWMDLLREIQSRGVSVWIACNTENIKVFHRELEPDKLFYICHAETQRQGEATLRWLVENT